ncbi:hypothetical protein AA0474_0992 [Acetobacter lovaniensis NRIC 0474]|nr:hypothetical protein AA0474_0992 [Acetobacter lovaniensis NRIC 0474]
MLGHHGGGEGKCPRRRTKAAKLHHLNENLHTGKTVKHGAAPVVAGLGVLAKTSLLF